MASGWSQNDPYLFSDGLMRSSIGLLGLAGGASVLKQGITANLTSTQAIEYNAARATYGTDGATATLGNIESRFAGASREVGFVVESDTGNILSIGRQPYSQSYDGFKFTPEQWATAEGNWVTHNHPSGNTLGIQDLASAVSNNARGIRAATPAGTFELAFDKSFAAAYRGDPGAAFGFLQAETNTIGRGILADVRSGTLAVPQGFTGLQKNGFLANEMWIRYANQTPGLQYTFTPRKLP